MSKGEKGREVRDGKEEVEQEGKEPLVEHLPSLLLFPLPGFK